MWYPLIDAQDGSEIQTAQALWESGSPALFKLHQGLTLTASLPLELELIIQGYCMSITLPLVYYSLLFLIYQADGHLRQYTLGQMARKEKKSPISPTSSTKCSDASLGGRLLGLHTVQNQRTREKYIVGGADDGSIAFWSLK